MKYVTGLYALNIPCNLNTCADWHALSLDWNNINIKDSKNSIYKDYGIEKNKTIPFNKEKNNVANHIRAILDLMIDGKTDFLKNMRKDFLLDEYKEEIFKQVYKLRNNKNWSDINKLMENEFLLNWLDFLKEQKNE